MQAQHASLADDVHRALQAADLDPCDLVLEITETALVQVANSTMSTLQGLRAEGVGIAIDDFGIGYASLRYVATLPVSAVKIDRSFTADLPHNQTSSKIVRAVTALAADMPPDPGGSGGNLTPSARESPLTSGTPVGAAFRQANLGSRCSDHA